MNGSTVAASPEQAGMWEDFVDIVHAPSEVFARRRDAGFWKPLLIIAVVSSILGFSTSRILAPVVDADTQRQAQAMQEKNPDVDVARGERMMDSARDFFALASGVFLAIAILVQGLLVWIGGKLAGSRINGRSAVLIATYASIPFVIGGIVMIIEGMLRGPASIESVSRLAWGPARFMDPDANWRVVQLLSEFDVFSIWWAVLVTIGLGVIGSMPRARAAGVVAAIWAVTSLPSLIGILAG